MHPTRPSSIYSCWVACEMMIFSLLVSPMFERNFDWENHHKSVNHALCYPCQPWAEKKQQICRSTTSFWSGCTSRSRSQGEPLRRSCHSDPSKGWRSKLSEWKIFPFFSFPLNFNMLFHWKGALFQRNSSTKNTKTSTILGCISHRFDQVNSTPCFSKHLTRLTPRRNFPRASPPALRPLIWWTLWSHHPWSRGCTRSH